MSQMSHVATTCNREIHLCLCKAEEQDDSEEETTGKKKCLVSLVRINFLQMWSEWFRKRGICQWLTVQMR